MIFFFKFDWDAETQSTVLGCFFYGYVLTQIPGGRMAEIFGGKWIFGCGILLTSIFTVLMPWAAKTDFQLLIAVRVIEGLGEGYFLHNLFRNTKKLFLTCYSSSICLL